MSTIISNMRINQVMTPKVVTNPVATPVFIRADQIVKAQTPAATVASPPVATKPLINPADLSVQLVSIKQFNPALSALLSNVTPPVEGVTRASLTVPVSLKATVTDEQFFESAQDASKRFYLPRYRIIENSTTTGRQFAVTMKQTPEGGLLSVKLEKYPASPIEQAAPTATEIPHLIAVVLQFNVSMAGGGTMVKEVNFPPAQPQPYGLLAELPVKGSPLFNQIYLAMTEGSASAHLIVRREMPVAVPVSPKGGGNDTNSRDIGGGIVSASKFKPVMRSPRMVVNSHVENVPVRPKAETVAVPTNTGIVPPNLQVPPPPLPPTETLYKAVSRSLDNVIPFTFPPALSAYIFTDITGGSNNSAPTLQQRQVNGHLYHQDMVQPGVFYYLPDSFKIARKPSPSFAPFMCVSIDGDGSLENTSVTIEYVAVPYTDADRIKGAETKLQEFLNQGTQIDFQPLIAPATFMLALPGAGTGTTGPFQERNGALVEIREGIHDSITVSLKSFQRLYDALMGASQTLFTGQIIVAVTDKEKIQIPLSARMSDLAGDVCSIRQAYDSATGKGTIVIRNEIESPVTVTAVEIMLSQGENAIPFNSQRNDVDDKMNISPQEEMTINITPLDASLSKNPLRLNTALSKVETQPDKEAIWNAILNPYSPIDYERSIAVQTFAEIFAPGPQETGDTTIKAIIVNFFNGNSVTLKPTVLEETATVNVSLSNYILGKMDTKEYKYQLEVITLAGKRKVGAPGEWITDQADDLFITKDSIK
jgi:hypothetical protein